MLPHTFFYTLMPKLEYLNILEFHGEHLCRCEGNTDAQGGCARLVVLCACWGGECPREGCACCPPVLGPLSLPASALQRNGASWHRGRGTKLWTGPQIGWDLWFFLGPTAWPLVRCLPGPRLHVRFNNSVTLRKGPSLNLKGICRF